MPNSCMIHGLHICQKPMRDLTARLRNTSAVLPLALAAACGGDLPTHPDWEGVGVLGEYIMHKGTKRVYSINVPSSYRDSEPAPLLIMFHGAFDSGPNFQRWSGLDSVAEAAGFITAYPNGKGSWCPDGLPQEELEDCPPFGWESEEIEFTRELIAHLRHELTIDARRIFAAGFSNGAVFMHELACEMAGEFAGVAVISALLYPETAVRCNPSRPISILLVNGTADETFPWEGGLYMSVSSTASFWAGLNGCTGEPTIEWLPDAEDDGTRVWTETYQDCDRSVEVVLYGIEGGGHTWPGVSGFPDWLGLTSYDISANEEIVRFSSRHSRPLISRAGR